MLLAGGWIGAIVGHDLVLSPIGIAIVGATIVSAFVGGVLVRRISG